MSNEILSVTNKLSTRIPIVSWKPKTFYSLDCQWRPMMDTNENTTGSILFKARPLKRLYRRERVVNTSSGVGSGGRKSVTIDLANSPGGLLLYTDTHYARCGNGTPQTMDVKHVEANRWGTLDCSETTACFSQQWNARRRVRSSGMVVKRYQPSTPETPDPVYFTDNRQYLVSRNRTVEQNNYAYIRKGISTDKPGNNITKTNIYSPQGLSHCKKELIRSDLGNNTFSYIWLDGVSYTVTLPDGYYDIDSFNHAFRLIQYNNGHYFTNQAVPYFLMQFSYNTLQGLVEMQVVPLSLFPSPPFTYAGGSPTFTQNIPQIVLSNANIDSLGFSPGTYPSVSSLDTTQIIVASTTGNLNPSFVSLYYKPSNPRFAHQGGVTASNYITRKRYDTITNNGYAYREAYGAAVADALAYSVPVPGYTIKDKLGYPNYCTQLKQCSLKLNKKWFQRIK